MPDATDVQLVRRGCFGPVKEIAWVVKAPLIQEAQKHAPDWKDRKRLAHTIANAIPTKEIKKILERIEEKAESKRPITTKDWSTTIPLTFPGDKRQNLHIVVSVSPGAIEIHPDYEKPKPTKNNIGTA